MSTSTFNWATVTDIDPLRIRVDGDSAELLLTPETLVDPAALAVDVRVRVELSDRRIIIHGLAAGDSRTADLVASMPAALAQGRRNLVRNARFRVNQRAWVSGVAVGTNGFTVDCWKTPTSTALCTYTGDETTGRVITLGNNAPTARQLRQVIERNDVTAGDYVLAWKGTVSARSYNDGASAPSYHAAAPDAAGVTAVAVTLDGTDRVRVDLEGVGQTVEWVALVRADDWSGHLPDISYFEDLAWCQRYAINFIGSAVGSVKRRIAWGSNASTTIANCVLHMPVPMRALPTLTLTGTAQWTDGFTADWNISALATYGEVAHGDVDRLSLTITHAATSAAGRGGAMILGTGVSLLLSSDI